MARGVGLGASGEGWIKQRFLKDEIEDYVDVVVTSAQILALNATPVELVPAPGAGKAVIFNSAQLMLDYNSAAYAGIAAGEDLTVKYTNGSGAQVAEIEATGFLDQTADSFRWAYPATAAGAVLPSVEPAANAALVLHMATDEIITGDSPLRVRVYFRVVDLDLSV